MPNLWLTCYKPNPSADLRVICYPYAGGSASVFHSWLKWLPDWVELYAVQPPGRAERISEPTLDNMNQYVDGLKTELYPLTDKPYVLFGHSMGALAAFESLVDLSINHCRLPEKCVFSAAHAPDRKNRMKPISALPDTQFIDELKALNGTPQQVFETPGLLEFCMKYIRADFSLVEQFVTEFKGKIEVDITLLYGSEDKINVEDIQEWQTFFTYPNKSEVMRGDHFFIHSEDNVKKVMRLLFENIHRTSMTV